MKIDQAKLKAIVETLKSIGRGLWFAILGLIAVALTAFATSGAVTEVYVEVAGQQFNVAFIILAVVGFLAKIIDTYIHKNERLDSNGIAPAFLQK